MKQFDPKKTVVLFDGSSFLYRAYYALKPMHTPQGQAVQAVYGFCRMIKKILSQFKPEYCAIAWDSKGKTARAEIYTEYKATRQAPPSDLFEQKELIKEFAQAVGIVQIEEPGVEADDLMYSAALDARKQGFDVILVTTDKDLGQLLDQNTFMFDSFKDALISKGDLEQKYGFEIRKLPFYFGLIGDSSDNIPGVRGIGPKTATELVQKFNSMDDLYNNLAAVTKERIRALLAEHKADAFLSQELFTLRYYNIGILISDCRYNFEQWNNARSLFERLAFKSLLKDMTGTPQQLSIGERVTVAQRLSFNLKAVVNEEDLIALVQKIKTAGYVAIDTETDGLDPMQAQLVGISLCVAKDEAYYVPCAHSSFEQLGCSLLFSHLKPLFADASIKKIMHNAKYDLHILRNAGLPVQGLVFDTLIAASLVTQDWQRIGLKYLSEFYLHEAMLSYQEVVTDKGYKNFKEVPLDLATLYAASDAHQTWALDSILKQELATHEQTKLYETIEFPLIEILVEMEERGIFCDPVILQDLNKYVTQDIQKVYEHIIDLIGDQYKSINFNSPKQLGHLLFEELKLTPVKKTGQKTAYSTDQEVLQELAKEHPVPKLILKYRELFKLKTTYIDALPTFINPKTQRIHTSFSQISAATGRLASFEPNLQNVPGLIRKAFRPAPGCVFLSSDYSQIELRVLAYLSQDATLLQAFARNEDIHKRTAVGLFDLPFDAVTSEQRQIAKRINFSILYGMTPYGLSKDLDISFAQAKDYIERFMSQYKGVQTWMEQVVQETEQLGYVTTYYGRRRYVPQIHEKNRSLYELGRRIAINTKGQGTAAEIMKLGMLHVRKSLLSKNLDAKIILQIHDELLLEVPVAQVEQTIALVQEVLQSVVAWNVPLLVTTRTGVDWHEVSK